MPSELFNGVQINNYTTKFFGASHYYTTGPLNGNLYYFDNNLSSVYGNVGSITPTGGFTPNKIFIFASSQGGNGNQSIGGGGSSHLIADLYNITVDLDNATRIDIEFNDNGSTKDCVIGFSNNLPQQLFNVVIPGGKNGDLGGIGGDSITIGPTGVSTFAGGNGGISGSGSDAGGNGRSVDFGVNKVYFGGGGGAAGGTSEGGYSGGTDESGLGAGRVTGDSSVPAITDTATSSPPAGNGESGDPINNFFGGGGGCGFGGGGGAGDPNAGSGAAGAVFIFVVAPPAPTDLEIGTVSDITSSGFKVTFTGGDGEGVTYSAMALEVASSGNPVNGIVDAGTKTITFTGLQPSTNYFVALTATNAGGTTSLSPATSQDITGADFLTEAETTSNLPKPVLVSKTSSTITVTGDSTGVSGGPFTGATFYIGYKGGEIAEDTQGSTEYIAGIYTHVFTGLNADKSYDISWSLSINGVEGQLSELIDGGVRTNANGNPICFLRGSKILCLNEPLGEREEYMPIEDMRVGTKVKTLNGSFVKVHSIGKTMFTNPDNADRGPNRLFKLSPANYPELTEDLIITGCHSRLVEKLEPKQKARHLQLMKTLYMTTGMFRLMAFIDEKAEPYLNPGSHEIWHFALENEEEVCNYGVYANGGLLVETASIKIMRERSGLVPVE